LNYHFEKNMAIQASFRKITKEILNEAILECNSKDLTQQEKIHSLRKKCKRIRGLFRIVRPNIGDLYKKENVSFRDLARTISKSRDEHATIETLEKLQNICKDESINNDIASLKNELSSEHKSEEIILLLKEFELKILNKVSQIDNWQVQSDGFSSVSGGIKKTYRRGQIAMWKAFNNPTMENYHEWRKRVKYHYYHLELITPIWEAILIYYTNEVHNLSEMLGYDHDLCLLEILLKTKTDYFPNTISIEALIKFINSEKINIREKINVLGQKVYAERPGKLIYKLDIWWNTWEIENSDV